MKRRGGAGGGRGQGKGGGRGRKRQGDGGECLVGSAKQNWSNGTS